MDRGEPISTGCFPYSEVCVPGPVPAANTGKRAALVESATGARAVSMRAVLDIIIIILDLYTWRVALDFPSWEDDDSSVHRIHCPAKNGTVWELRKVDREMTP